MKNQLLRILFASAGLMATGAATAQMVGPSVFLKGHYVEAGICANGDFGAASPPAGYHPHHTSTPTTLLGFVADPDSTGWSTATTGHYKGDFFTPGSPFEGWNLQIGSVRAQAHSCAGFAGSGGLTGANTGYVATGSTVKGTWEGMFDSIAVKQETILDTNAMYFKLRITLTNTASVPKNDIYYLRSLDPDNDQTWPGGGFPTLNKIEYQLPNPTNATVVSARGLGDPDAFISLGTNDTNARCLIYSAWPIASSTDLSTIFSSTFAGTYTMGATWSNDVAIGIAFRIAHLAPVDSASDSIVYRGSAALRPANQQTFTYFYAFRRDAVDSAIKELTPAPTPTPTVITTVGGQGVATDIKVYPNPAAETINITGIDHNDRVQLYDIMGKAIGEPWHPLDAEVNTFSIADAPPGLYIIRVMELGALKATIPLRKQ